MQHSYKNRGITDKLVNLFNNFPVVVITGGRQVGKSTLLEHVYPKIPKVVFDPIVDVENARQDPDLFLDNRSTPLILDEIQYAPEVVPALKRRIDKDKSPGRYLITGSQQWEVMKLLSESLAGRAIILNLEGFSLPEIADIKNEELWLVNWLNNYEKITSKNATVFGLPFTTYEHLWRGFLPETLFIPKEFIPDYLLSYLKTYIERDVRQLAEVSDLPLFSRFFKLVSVLSAQEINYSQIGREIGITPQTALRWLNILSSTFQWNEIPAYSGNALKRISGKNKGYICDTGLICLALAISSPEVLGNQPQLGHIFETAVINDIRKQAEVLPIKPNFYHWRSHAGAEVDLLLEWNGSYYPIEIKIKTTPEKRDCRGIEAFKETYPNLNVKPALIVCLSYTMYPISDDIFVMPWNAQIRV